MVRNFFIGEYDSQKLTDVQSFSEDLGPPAAVGTAGLGRPHPAADHTKRPKPYSDFAANGSAFDVMSSGAKSLCSVMTLIPGLSKSMALRSTIWIFRPP